MYAVTVDDSNCSYPKYFIQCLFNKSTKWDKVYYFNDTR